MNRKNHQFMFSHKITLRCRILIVIAFVALTSQCSSIPTSSRFGERQDRGIIEFDAIREASGIVASRINPGVLWLHNDSGNRRALYAINTQGKHLGVYFISGCDVQDWEDIAIGSSNNSGVNYIYIGAIGDNHLKRGSRSICRIVEPKVDAHQAPVKMRIAVDARLDFTYPKGRADAEALMIDPQGQVLYIISKRSKPATVFELPLPIQPYSQATAKPVAVLPYRYVVAADISADGNEILIKTYTDVYYWKRLTKENLSNTLKRPPTVLPYRWETQGEAISWSANASGYFTVSEENLGIDAHLYFYPRQ